MGHVVESPLREAKVKFAPDLTLVIPAYNEASRLPATLAAIKDELDQWPLDYHVLVVDDGSRDGTWEVLDGFDSRFSCWRLTKNSGKGAAVKAGMLQATGRVVAFTDADLPFDLSALEAGSAWIASGKCDIVCGDRTTTAKETNHGASSTWMRWLSGLVFRQVVGWIVAPAVRDTQCGLKIFSRRAAQKVFASIEATGFAFDVEVVCRAQRLGFSIETIPVTLVNTAGSTISLWRHTLPMLRELFAIRSRLNALPPSSVAVTSAQRRAA